MKKQEPKAERSRKQGPQGYQFGTFKGVYTPSILTVLGVVMYLRFGWVLGSVGLFRTLVIVTVSTAITFLTGLSLSALATNRRIEGGGAYYIISRSLGVEAGAAVGLPLFFAQALGIAFYIAGFSEAVLAQAPFLVENIAIRLGLADAAVAFCAGHAIQILGIITLVLLTIMAYLSADWALKAQFGIMAVIFASLAFFFLGNTPEISVPKSDVPPAMTFWPVFAVFFPAVTGIEAGLAMSGDLKDPARSLPRGTIAAVLTGWVVYMVIPLFLSYVLGGDTDVLRHGSLSLIMEQVALWGPPIVAGVWCASISSAIGALLGAPRTLQALAKDRVIPPIFGRGFGEGNDPRIATATAFIVGAGGIILGDLNVIAPILSMFFLTSYGLLNVSAALEEITSPPSWRPKFRVPWPISMIGAVGCFAVMFMISAGATFAAAAVALTVYILMERRSLKAWWGDVRSGLLMLVARNAIYALAKRKPHARTWKPNILVLSGSPANRWYLVELARAIAQDRGLLTVAAIVPTDMPADRVDSLQLALTDFLEKRRVPALVKLFRADNAMAGAWTLAQSYGYGPIVPNTLLLGETEQPENYPQFARLLRTAHEQRKNLIVVRESGEAAAPARRPSRVDLWWYGTQQNLGLMLAIAYLLRRSSEWRQSELVLKSIVPASERAIEVRTRLETFIAKGRLQARAEVIVHEGLSNGRTGDSKDADTSESGNPVFDIIRERSAGADLVLLGMRPPAPDETDRAYAEYYGKFLQDTEGLPAAALVLASEDVDFFAIFVED